LQEIRITRSELFLGGFLVQEGHPREALPFLEKACKLIPDSWAAFSMRQSAIRIEAGREGGPAAPTRL